MNKLREEIENIVKYFPENPFEAETQTDKLYSLFSDVSVAFQEWVEEIDVDFYSKIMQDSTAEQPVFDYFINNIYKHMNLKSAIEDKLSKPFRIIPNKGNPYVSIIIKWSAALRAYAIYQTLFGSAQTIERIAERGGFHESEIDEFYPEWRNHIINNLKTHEEEA